MRVTAYPEMVCATCGHKYGQKPPTTETRWHLGACQVCHTDGPVAQAQTFGDLDLPDK